MGLVGCSQTTHGVSAGGRLAWSANCNTRPLAFLVGGLLANHSWGKCGRPACMECKLQHHTNVESKCNLVQEACKASSSDDPLSEEDPCPRHSGSVLEETCRRLSWLH